MAKPVIDADDLTTALESSGDFESRWYLDRETGAVIFLTDDSEFDDEDEDWDEEDEDWDDEEDGGGDTPGEAGAGEERARPAAEAKTDENVPDWLREERAVRREITRGSPRYVYIEPVSSNEGWRMMEDFVTALPEGAARVRLYDAIDGPKPFRRFKDIIAHYPELREEWFAFKDRRMREAAWEWLWSEKIDAELRTAQGERLEPPAWYLENLADDAGP